MRVFISWSGPRGKKIGAAFRNWLPDLIQAVDPFYSPNIEKGDRWSEEIKAGLRDSKVGLICVTPESMLSPWLIFEAGAISNAALAKVCPLLFDLVPGQVQGPLNQFQATAYSKDEVRQLVATINGLVNTPLLDAQLERNFERLWPELEREIGEALAAEREAATPAKRSTDDMLEEVLATVRTLVNNIPLQPAEPQSSEETIHHWMVAFRSLLDYGSQVDKIGMSSSKNMYVEVLTATINHLRTMLNLIQPKISKSKQFAQFEKEAKTLMAELQGTKDLYEAL